MEHSTPESPPSPTLSPNAPTVFENPFTPEQMKQYGLWTFRELRAIALMHKDLIWLVALRLALPVVEIVMLAAVRPRWLVLIALLVHVVVIVWSALLVLSIGYTRRATWNLARGALTLFPVLGLVIALLEEHASSRKLRAIGLTVGFLGTSRADFDRLSLNDTYIVRENETGPAAGTPSATDEATERLRAKQRALTILVHWRRSHILLVSLIVNVALVLGLTPVFNSPSATLLGLLLLLGNVLWLLVNYILLLQALRLGVLGFVLFIVLCAIPPFCLQWVYVGSRIRDNLESAGVKLRFFLGPSRSEIRELREQIAQLT